MDLREVTRDGQECFGNGLAATVTVTEPPPGRDITNIGADSDAG